MYKRQGIFKGKNLILILCESLSTIVIDEELTPTLYMMKTQGINFDNHYAPVYQSATADSEFISLTSQIPSIDNGPLAYDFYENTFPSALPQLFREIGYSANSFHSFKKEFYNRETLHYTYGFTSVSYTHLIRKSAQSHTKNYYGYKQIFIFVFLYHKNISFLSQISSCNN